MGQPTLLVPGNLAGAARLTDPKTVPIDYIISRIRLKMPEFGGKAPNTLADRVFIVQSKTGSGKSTVLPAEIFRLLRSNKAQGDVVLTGPGVICTQPRILTAQTIARDQAADQKNYPDLVMGVTIGYQTGPLNEKPAHGLVYATAGSLLAQLRTLPDGDIFARYRFIIVDEGHERSLDIDALLMHLKIFLKRNLGNPRLPFVIIASATLPIEKYAAYFEVGDANIIEVEGRAFGVETRWPLIGTNDYPRAAAQMALEIHKQNPEDPPEKADILIFVPGMAEITIVTKLLEKANKAFRSPGATTPPYLILAIYREVISEGRRDYQLMKEDPTRLAIPNAAGVFMRPSRRIIISTVVAETGLTIETLKYVVDCGWSRVQETYFPGRYRGIVTRPAPQSRIEQRKGRAGRKFPGVFYPLYTQNLYAALPVEQLPEIIMEGVTPIFLDIVSCASGAGGIFRVERIDMLDPPPVDALAAALEEAVVFGYLRAHAPRGAVEGHIITKLGAAAARFVHLQMHHVQTLLAGYLWRVALRDLALIVAIYDLRDALLYAKAPPSPRQAEEDAAARQKAFRTGLPLYLVTPSENPALTDLKARILISDDFIEALLAFEGFVRALDNYQGDLLGLLTWCEANGVSFEGATLLAGLRDEVLNEMLGAGLNPFWGDAYRLVTVPPEAFLDTVIRLKYCIYAGLRFSQVTHDARSGCYRARGGEKVEVPARYGTKTLELLRAVGDIPPGVFEALSRPRRLVTNTIRIRKAQGDKRDKTPPLLYRLSPGLVSVLDGYVNIDEGFFDPRLGRPGADHVDPSTSVRAGTRDM